MTESTARHYEDLARDVAAGQFDTREVVEALEAPAFNTRANMAAHAKAAAARTPEQRKSPAMNPAQTKLDRIRADVAARTLEGDGDDPEISGYWLLDVIDGDGKAER